MNLELYLKVEHLDVEKLLAEWRWLCPAAMIIIARNTFADLYLRDEHGRIFQLDVAVGKLTKVADSQTEFLEAVQNGEKREDWFGESDEIAATARGLRPTIDQCIGFSVPLVFAEAGSPDTAFVTDIYDHVSFLGELHRQIPNLPDGAKIRLNVKC